MKNKKLLLILTLLCSPICFCQVKDNRLFFELGGSGGIASVNYERPFNRDLPCEVVWRAGLSFAPIDRNNGTGIVIPLSFGAILGRSAHHAEFGLGQGLTFTTKGKFFALTTAVAGYRFQRADRRFFYRVSYTPLISYLVDFQYQNWAGISIGYSFKPSER